MTVEKFKTWIDAVHSLIYRKKEINITRLNGHQMKYIFILYLENEKKRRKQV
jgi:hypothetical protein